MMRWDAINGMFCVPTTHAAILASEESKNCYMMSLTDFSKTVTLIDVF